MKFHIPSTLALTALAICPAVARADDAIDTLGAMHRMAPVDWPTIPQTGAEG